MNACRKLMARTFPDMDVVWPVRYFDVVTVTGKTVRKVAARDTTEAMNAVDDAVVAIYDLTPDPAKRTILGASRRRKHGL